MKDLQGRVYADKNVIVEGSKLTVGEGFSCIDPGTQLTVGTGEHGLYIPCRLGKHYIDGQLFGDNYIGLYHVE